MKMYSELSVLGKRMLRVGCDLRRCRFAASATAAGIAIGAPFADVTLKPFPVRAAFDIGSGGVLSLIVARVDRRNKKIRDVLHQTSLPLLQDARPSVSGDAKLGCPLVLSEQSWADIVNKMRLLHGLLKRDFGVVERAAVMTAPLCQCSNARALAQFITKEFKVKVRLLQDDAADRRQRASDGESGAIVGLGADTGEQGLSEAMALLAFDAYCCQTQAANRHRVVVVVEDAESGELSLVGSKVAPGAVVDTESEAEEDALLASPLEALIHHRLPLSCAEAHRVFIAMVQRRPYLSRSQSPNPVTQAEFSRSVGHFESILKATTPSWVLEKIAAGGVLCGTSHNGGMLNTAARVSGHVIVTVDKVEVAALYHYCALTDVLIGQNYPFPQLVVPQAALASALLRALCAPRVEYVPSVTLAAGVLVNERYWTQKDRLAGLEKQRFFRGAKFRTFSRPRRAEDKSAPAGISPHDVAALKPLDKGFKTGT